MLILYDFKRPDGRVVERLVPRDTTNIVCDDGTIATRVISPVRGYCDGTDPGFPGAYDKWGRDHAKRGGESEQTKDEAASN